MNFREQLAELLIQQALIRNHNNYFIDARRVTLSSLGAYCVGHVVLEKIHACVGKPRAIGGMELGATAIIMSTIIAAAEEQLRLDAFLVRAKPRPNGAGRWKWVEGFTQRGPVVIVEDVTTSGNSVVKVIERVREEGMTPQAVITLIDREEGAQAQIRPLCPFYAIFTAEELLQNPS